MIRPNTRPQKAEPTPIEVTPETVTASVPAAARRSWSPASALPALAGYYHTISFLCNGLKLPLEPYAARFPG